MKYKDLRSMPYSLREIKDLLREGNSIILPDNYYTIRNLTEIASVRTDDERLHLVEAVGYKSTKDLILLGKRGYNIYSSDKFTNREETDLEKLSAACADGNAVFTYYVLDEERKTSLSNIGEHGGKVVVCGRKRPLTGEKTPENIIGRYMCNQLIRHKHLLDV